MAVFFVADTHFGHANIIKYEQRPFKDIDDMTEKLIERWNNAVKKEDTVYVLGDFSWYNKEKTAAITAHLNGRKILVKGNHDNYSPESYRAMGFIECYKYPIIIDDFIMLSHQPLYINEHMPYKNIYGHVHSNPNYKTFSESGVCVSIERIHYAPISLDRIMQEIDSCKHE
jgi:calcineurin-like phosphoesterase family protein